MTTTSAIMAFNPVSTEVENIETTRYGPLVDHIYGNLYQWALGSTASASGIRIFDSWRNGGVETRARNLQDMGGQITPVVSTALPWAMLYNLQAVAFNSGGGNSSTISVVRARNMDLLSVFGVGSSSLSPSGGNRMLAPDQMRAISNGRGKDFLVCTTIIASNEVVLVDPVAKQCTIAITMTEGNGIIGAPPDGSGNAAFILGKPSTRTAARTLYSITLNGPNGLTGIATATLGTFLYSQVDATWTGIDLMAGMAIDQTDGNPIVAVGTNDVVASPFYLLKLNKTNGAILWKLAMPTFGFDNIGMNQALIKNGIFYYYTGTSVSYPNPNILQINTVTGAIINTYSFANGNTDSLHPSQVSEDVANSLYFYGSWGAGSVTPNYVGNYMGVLGNHTFSSFMARYFPNTPNPAPVSPIAGSPRQRAWSFTLDGHTFYALDLGTEGTLLFDTNTQQWCKFITQGYTNWNFRNGWQWGQRVVAGDTDSTQLYEQNPGSSLKDGNSIDIQHVVTGGLVKRDRVFSSVESLRLAMSAGLLDDTTSATVTLAFSDDGGNTWTTMDTYTLTESDFSAEIEWPSLGAFAAPGRIFSIVDVGGFLSISGCDAMLDNFDDDSNSQTQEPSRE